MYTLFDIEIGNKYYYYYYVCGFIDRYFNTIHIFNNEQFIVHPVINYWSCPQSGQEFSS